MPISDLINIKFEDNSNYFNSTSSDTFGIVFPYYWGSFNKINYLNSVDFYQMYPNVEPYKGHSGTKLDLDYTRYIQIVRFFESGGSFVEVVRPTKGGIASINLSDNSISLESKQNRKNILYSKYSGVPPSSVLMSGDDTLGVMITSSGDYFTLKVVSFKYGTSDYTSLEEIDFSTDSSYILDGKNIFLPKALTKSEYLLCFDFDLETISTTSEPILLWDKVLDEGVDFNLEQGVDYTSYFSDITSSRSTILYGKEFIPVASERKDVMALIDYPIDRDFDSESISNYKNSLPKSMFACFLAAREFYEFRNKVIQTTCAGAWCGCLFNIANSVRINQISSSYTYGGFSGNLSESLSFDEVLTLHESGIISIYNSTIGPIIFGVRSLHSRQNSYFGKLNVMRVITRLLKDVYPLFLSVIHTDTAQNPISRSVFGVQLQSVVDSYIANQDLRVQSTSDVSGSINTDETTKGGTVLNAVFNLWFIGLVEKVNLKIVATDSSVATEIS